ncbi:MAG TPA: YggS family pyridoxal phosphate-dependent enzyme [Bacteroidales bacterium]|nr:YggS family pyridoxal phosphate-dependent enzyme [Bacteroidales bacterium]HNR43075.1 YggS family pyridoxal phosphate-dependent enzyme [Bacteroidales bacterium]HPM19070.1 YggS family pyridoxal phosphate-dependent enzyme [Bacteroidales bacterium]HQG78381.1 YggS family pyridoxal phosphate-dependent enzyme [Bacteroidales bacterium]
MTDIASNIRSVKTALPPGVKLVAVSKAKSPAEILEAYNAGQRCFGENRVMELAGKKDVLPPDIEWHLIGHLQTNKVKYLVPFISMIESVDSFRLLKIIDNEASKVNRVISCLLQIHIAEEETKFGFTMDELYAMLENADLYKLRNVNICGVMGMATFTGNREQIRNEFRYLSKCFNDVRNTYFRDNENFKEISMGMSGDYEIAVEEGSTIVRIGSLIFGAPVKNNKQHT